jgi:hypothetical protein
MRNARTKRMIPRMEYTAVLSNPASEMLNADVVISVVSSPAKTDRLGMAVSRLARSVLLIRVIMVTNSPVNSFLFKRTIF